MKKLIIVSAVLALSACKNEPSAAAKGVDASTPDDPAADVEQEAAPEPYLAFVDETTIIRRQMTKDTKVKDPQNPEKKVSNWLATVYRGEEVNCLEDLGDWSRVKTTSGREGFALRSGLLKKIDTGRATTLEEVKTFSRPDILAMRSGKMVDAGTLLYIINDKEEFAHVSNGFAKTWVRLDSLSRDEQEINVAKLLTQIRYQERKGKADNIVKATELRKLGLETYPEAALAKLLVVEEVEAEKDVVEEESEGAGDSALNEKLRDPNPSPEQRAEDRAIAIDAARKIGVEIPKDMAADLPKKLIDKAIGATE